MIALSSLNRIKTGLELEKTVETTNWYITGPTNAVKLVEDVFKIRDKANQQFAVIYLDNSFNIVGLSLVHAGTANGVSVSMRDVFQPALLLDSKRIVVVQNNPDSFLRVTNKVRAIKKKLKRAERILDIEVIDYIIVSPFSQEIYSLGCEGQLN